MSRISTRESTPPSAGGERSQAERMLRTRADLLETCISRINDLVIITSADGFDEPEPRILFVNDTFTQVTGFTREEALGRSPRFLQGPKTQRPELDRIRLALKRGEPVRAELINYKKCGGELWLEVDIVPVAGADGRPAYHVGVMRDATDRKRAENDARATEERFVRQRNALIALTGLPPLESGDGQHAFHRITEAHARALGVARVGIWRYNKDRTAIRCVDLYELESHRHSSGMVLTAESCPAYFAALEEMDVIPADDALNDPRTREFAAGYLRPLGISSMLDAPIHFGGTIAGVMCSEHVGPARTWTGDEKTFVAAVANLVSLSLESTDRHRAEEVVLKVAQAVSSGTGTEFFDLLTRNMVEALGAHGGLIGRLNPRDLSVTTLSFMLDGRLEENVTYGLAGTPCENVSEGRVCVFDRGVQELFPEDHLLVVYGIHAYAGIPLKHRDGTVGGIMVVFYNAPLKETALVESTLQIFAARASAELDRQLSDDRIREQASLLDQARDAILLHELDHRITYWNKSAERLYGWTAEEALGRSAEALLYRDPADFRAACRTVMETGEWLGELRHFTRDGREIHVEGRWTLLHNAAGQPRHILAIHTDVTEHRQLKQQFLRAQRLESIGTLAGGIAHDLNNVLAPISMSIELLRSEVHSERGRELLATLAGSARRGADMVSQVLSFARGMEGRRVEILARQLVGDVESIVRDTFPKDITLDIRIPRQLWTLQGDPTQLHQVLINLCVNARDAMPGGGRIAIAAENLDLDAREAAKEPGAKPGPYVRISVEDSGSGIPPQHLEKIFEPFFTTKDVGKGTGLGLSTSLAIVKGHGGFIRAASPAGRGARFDRPRGALRPVPAGLAGHWGHDRSRRGKLPAPRLRRDDPDRRRRGIHPPCDRPHA